MIAQLVERRTVVVILISVGRVFESPSRDSEISYVLIYIYMKYRKTVRRRRKKNKSRKNIAQRKKCSRKQKKRTTMKGGREKNIAERVISIIDRVIEALDQVQKREAELKDAELKDAELKAKATSGTALKDDPKYEKYFKMLNRGVPRGGVEQKMRADGLDPDDEKIKMFLDQHAPQAQEGRVRPVANPFAGRQGPMSGLLDGIRKQQGKPRRAKSSTTPSRRAKKAKTHDNNSTSHSPFSLNGNQLTKVISNLRKTTNRINPPALPPKPMSIVDNFQRELKHTLNGKRREYNNAAPKIPREKKPESKSTKSEVVIEEGNEFHIIGVNSSDGKITKHMGVVQNIDEKTYAVEIIGSDTVLNVSKPSNNDIARDDIVAFKPSSEILLGYVKERLGDRIKVNDITDKKKPPKTYFLKYVAGPTCQIRWVYKNMETVNDINYYGGPKVVYETCPDLPKDYFSKPGYPYIIHEKT